MNILLFLKDLLSILFFIWQHFFLACNDYDTLTYMKFYVGLNLSHDSSVALLDSDGNILFALGEERVNRIKGFTGWPIRSFKILLDNFPKLRDSADLYIVIGSHSYFEKSDLITWRLILTLNSENYFDSINMSTPPAWFYKYCDKRLLNVEPKKLKDVCTAIISEKLNDLGLKYQIKKYNI